MLAQAGTIIVKWAPLAINQLIISARKVAQQGVLPPLQTAKNDINHLEDHLLATKVHSLTREV